MKSINIIIREILRKLLMSIFTGITFLFLMPITSCNKNSFLDKNKADLTTANAETALMNDALNHGRQHVNVRSMGAAADGITDDTKAFQKAIDLVATHGGGMVWVPPGNYSINADTSIYLKSKVILSMADSARLIAAGTSHERYCVIKALNIHDAQVLGGRIIGDRDYHLGTTGEHGYGIAIQGCDNVQVKNTNISNCWGDGLIISSAGGIPSTNTTLKSVVCNNNRRQGISIFEVNGVLIDSCQLSNTNGTKPGDGIDIEPDVTSRPLIAQNITITHCDMFSNSGNGGEINVRGSNIV
jgi:polygalacturonase